MGNRRAAFPGQAVDIVGELPIFLLGQLQQGGFGRRAYHKRGVLDACAKFLKLILQNHRA
ncbi:MAG TPA: hypothetical protein DCP28_26135 [Cytophagales bacterium]|nr:hypothetical protein [Cytophagales bacterium]